MYVCMSMYMNVCTYVYMYKYQSISSQAIEAAFSTKNLQMFYFTIVKFRKIFVVGNQMSLYHVKNLENCRLCRWFSASYAKLAFMLYSSYLASLPDLPPFIICWRQRRPRNKANSLHLHIVRMYTVLPSIETGVFLQINFRPVSIDKQLQKHNSLPVYEYPSCLQTTEASGTLQKSLHTVPQWSLMHNSTLPSY